MIILDDLTIVIPVKIESNDRYNNLKTILGYINHHLKTNIKIIEESPDIPKIDFLDDFKNLSIDYKFYQVNCTEPFHRTKYLNEMIFSTTTKVVSNYDSDVFFTVQTYVDVVKSIIDGDFDFVYPYLLGIGQKRLYYSKWYENKSNHSIFYPMWKFIQDWDISIFDNDEQHIKMWTSAYGHSVFADTNKYKEAFGENEEFISYGPEDQERAYRFQKLGYNVNWYNGYVYHIEHIRTNDSSNENPQFYTNCQIFEYIKTLSKEELIDYYNKREYLKKYTNEKY
jgi:hypothetical protein